MTSGGPQGWPHCCLRGQSTDEEGNYRPANSITSTDLYRGYGLLASRLCLKEVCWLKKGSGTESNWRGVRVCTCALFLFILCLLFVISSYSFCSHNSSPLRKCAHLLHVSHLFFYDLCEHTWTFSYFYLCGDLKDITDNPGAYLNPNHHS